MQSGHPDLDRGGRSLVEIAPIASGPSSLSLLQVRYDPLRVGDEGVRGPDADGFVPLRLHLIDEGLKLVPGSVDVPPVQRRLRRFQFTEQSVHQPGALNIPGSPVIRDLVPQAANRRIP